MEVYLTAYQKLHRDSLEILFDKEGMSNNKQY